MVNVGRQAVPVLVAALNGGDEETEVAAAAALGEIGDRSVVPALVKALRRACGRNPSLCLTAIRALGKIKSPKALPVLFHVIHYEIKYDPTYKSLNIFASNHISQ